MVVLLLSDSFDPKVNVLVDNDGHACLADFGLLTIISDEPTITSTAGGATTAQWTSPELLVPEQFGLKEGRPTEASDCYALGMVIYEVLSGRTPFAQYSFLAVVWKVLEGERPERPRGAQGMWFTDNVWETLELCWKPQPRDRINAKTVLLGLEGNPCPPMSPSDATGTVSTDSDEQSDLEIRGTIFRFLPRLTFNYSCPVVVPLIGFSDKLLDPRQPSNLEGRADWL